ncbi:MAG: hypothetical protein ABI690_23420 [Chloroflexota bacterium]
MENILRYEIGHERFVVSHPSVADIKSCIDQMDNDIRTGFTLELPSGILALAGGNRDRVVVGFNGRRREKSFRWGRLVDPQCIGSNEEIAISAEGEINHEPLYLTVSKETAFQVASFFLGHDAFPEELTWDGNMNKSD